MASAGALPRLLPLVPHVARLGGIAGVAPLFAALAAAAASDEAAVVGEEKHSRWACV